MFRCRHLAFGALCLNNAPQGRAVDVWAFYEGALATADPVKLFGGSIDDCVITEAMVSLQLFSLDRKKIAIPRRRITRDTGFNHLSPAGRVISFGGQRYVLERG